MYRWRRAKRGVWGRLRGGGHRRRYSHVFSPSWGRPYRWLGISDRTYRPVKSLSSVNASAAAIRRRHRRAANSAMTTSAVIKIIYASDIYVHVIIKICKQYCYIIPTAARGGGQTRRRFQQQPPARKITCMIRRRTEEHNISLPSRCDRVSLKPRRIKYYRLLHAIRQRIVQIVYRNTQNRIVVLRIFKIALILGIIASKLAIPIIRRIPIAPHCTVRTCNVVLIANRCELINYLKNIIK